MNALHQVLAAESQASGGGLAGLLPLLLIGGLFIYLMTAQTRKQKKQQAELMASLQVGDEIVTAGGIHGSVSYIEDDVIHVLVDTDVVIRVSKGSVSRRSPAGGDEATDHDDADASDEAVDVTDDAALDDGGTSKRASKRTKPSSS